MTTTTCLRILWIGLLIVVSPILTTNTVRAALFHGRVVDAETEEPLEGTVIVVRWDRAVLYPCMDSCTTYYDAAEAVADAQGKFSIDISMGWVAVRRKVTIYKPGYHVPGYYAYPWIHSAEGPPPQDGETIRLIKIKRRDDPRIGESWVGYCTEGDNTQWCVPQRKVRNYIRLFELYQKIQGY